MVLTACFVLSPVRPGFVVTVRATLEASSRPRQCVNALRGRHLHRGARTTRLRRPRHVVRQTTSRVHRIPLPTSVTIAKRPSCGDGTRGRMVVICPTTQEEMCTTGSLRMAGMQARVSLLVIPGREASPESRDSGFDAVASPRNDGGVAAGVNSPRCSPSPRSASHRVARTLP